MRTLHTKTVLKVHIYSEFVIIGLRVDLSMFVRGQIDLL